MHALKIPEGQLTAAVYALVKDNKHDEAIAHLEVERQVRELEDAAQKWPSPTLALVLRAELS